MRRALLLIALAAVVHAQCLNSIVAGPPSTSGGDGQQATSAWLSHPKGVALDASGNLFIADSGNNRIRKVTTDGAIHTVAGPDTLNNPQAVLAAPDGSVYVADTDSHRILRISASGVIIPVAGTGHPGFSGDNGSATAAELNGPTGMALDAKGRLYFADSNNSRVRRIDASGTITTIAGGGPPSATSSTTTSNTTTTSGNSGPRWDSGASGDGGPATAARLATPRAIVLLSDGSIYILDTGNDNIRRIEADGTISTVGGSFAATDLMTAGDGSLLLVSSDLLRLSADGWSVEYYMRASGATNAVAGPSGIYFSSTANVIYHAAIATNTPRVFAGQYYFGNAADQSPALGPAIASAAGMVAGPDGSIWFADNANGKIRRLQPDGTLRIVASAYGISQLALDPSGNLYAASTESNTVLKYGANGSPEVFAGGGYSLIPRVAAPPVPATSVDLSEPVGVVADSSGNLFVLSLRYGYGSQALITRIAPNGLLTTIWDSTASPEYSAGFYAGSFQGFAMDFLGNLVLPIGYTNQVLLIRPDGKGTADVLNAAEAVTAIAGSPSGEIFYATSAGRVKSLHTGATIFNRDIAADETSYYGELAGLPAPGIAGTIITILLARPAPNPSLAADAQGDLYYYSSAAENVIRRFPASSCFIVLTPHIASISRATPASNGTPLIVVVYDPYYPEWFAPGELITLTGKGMGPKSGVKAQAGSDGRIPLAAAGTQVFFDNIPAPVLYSSDDRVDVIVPFTMYGHISANVQVAYQGVLSDVVAVAMSDISPTVFRSADADPGNSWPTVINQNGTINSYSNPAIGGSVITIYGTGFGRTVPEGVDGHVATTPLPKLALPVSAYFGDQPAAVLYAGDVAGMVEGVVQVNVQLPRTTYDQTLYLSVGPAELRIPVYFR